MKKLFKVFAITIALVGLAIVSYAQTVSDNTTAEATIIKPIAIENTQPMNFGNIAVGAVGGTVVLVPAGTRSLGVPGSLVLPTTFPGTIQQAIFHVTGNAGYVYNVTLPNTTTTPHIITLKTDNTKTMNVIAFTDATIFDPALSPTQGKLDINGEDDIWVGATLEVAGDQAAGVYISGGNTGVDPVGTQFTVTVGYN
jgi:hypothetical protein